MLATTTDLTRYLYLPSKGITLSITGSTTSGDTISTADGQKYLLDAEAKVSRVFGDVPFIYTRVSSAYTADATSISVDKIDTDDWPGTGYIYFNGMNVAYTGLTTTTFTGLSSSYTIPAAPVGAFVIEGSGDELTGWDDNKRYEAEMYFKLELICKEAAYNIWVSRFPADDLPKIIDDWRNDVLRALAQRSSGMGYVRL